MHVGDVLALDRSRGGEQPFGRVGVVGVHVDLDRGLVADDENRIAELLERGHERGAVERFARDDEVRAVAVLGAGVMDLVEAGRCVVRDLGDLGMLAGKPGDETADDDHEPERAGIDDACLGQDLELLGGVAKRLLAAKQRRRQHLGQQGVLLLGAGIGLEALAEPLRATLGDGVCHRPDHGQHRSLGRLADRGVGAVGGIGERRLDQLRVDQAPRRSSQLLGSAADDLAQDHARVAARAHQRRAGDLAHDHRALRVAVLALEHVELVEHVAHRQGHVVAGVTVGDREHVEIVDLLATLLEMRKRNRDDLAKTMNRLVRHQRQQPTRSGASCLRTQSDR